jgi:hypothetical protein
MNQALSVFSSAMFCKNTLNVLQTPSRFVLCSYMQAGAGHRVLLSRIMRGMLMDEARSLQA